MSLTEYRRKRDFKKTPEPRGRRTRQRAKLSFVIQKHDASHLHYDFRLELDGVLKSWAVPKGPDCDPAVKRLAMQVEDHPLEYGKFEGMIPRGEYGGGTVLLWDRGTWEPIGDAHKDLRDGQLKFILHGEKMRGGWMLVRRSGRNAETGERAWFLFKERDEFADANETITDKMPLSVATGRDLDEIAAQADRVWGPKGEIPHSGSKVKQKRTTKSKPRKSKTVVQSVRSRATANHRVAGVVLSHPDKILYPDQGITKRDLAEYYELVSDWMLPHVAGRVLALVRCPAGRAKPCFFQKHPGESPSEHLQQVNVSLKKAAEYHLAIDDLSGLIALVQMGTLEIHVWGSTVKHLEKPNRLIFDLDPDPAVKWPQVVAAAREVRLLLKELGLTSFLKTTGGKGLHIAVPIRPRTPWDDAKAFCRAVAEFIVRAAPDRYIATASKAARKGKIFIDYLRNGRGATAIAPYSTRARPGATVSVPIDWDELSARLRSDHFTIRNLPGRLKNLKKDPWAKIDSIKQSITAAMLKRLQP